MKGTIHITGDPAADALINSDPAALVLGMLLDQQVPMEWAFKGPSTLQARLGHLDVRRIAAMDPEDLVAVCCDKPAVHRYPAAMAQRIHDVCVHLCNVHDGDAAALWTGVPDGAQLFARMRAVPGFGEEKSQIFCAILAKRFGIAPEGWREAAGVFADDVPRSVADSRDPASLLEVRAFKKAMKQARRDKQGRSLV